MNVLTILLLAAAAASGAKGYVTYEEFGAVGDGKTDDQAAIIAAHAAANEKGLPVKASDGRTYYIGKGKEVAVIKTDVDWGNAKFIIDDVITDNYRSPIFRVESDLKPYALENLTPPRKGQKKLSARLNERSLVAIADKGHKNYIREGLNQNKGYDQQEVLKVRKNGVIEPGSEIIWDYDNVSSAMVYPIDRRQLTLRGGEFTTIANQAPSQYKYRHRCITINRSNVLVENVKHYVKGEIDHGAPYQGFIVIVKAADVTVRNCLFTAHKIYVTIGAAGKPVNMGSYDITANSSVNIRFEHCRQTTDIDDTRYWGVFTSNFCKGLYLEDCIFSRFDAHMGVFNVTLKNCTFGHQGIRMVGSGLLLVENCTTHMNSMLQLRGDYGSSWDGDIVFRNCVWDVSNTRTSTLKMISGSNTGKHDFGYACRFPKKITVDGLVIKDGKLKPESYKGPELFAGFNRSANGKGLIPYPIEGQVILKNVTVESGKEFSVGSNPKLFSKMEIIRK